MVILRFDHYDHYENGRLTPKPLESFSIVNNAITPPALPVAIMSLPQHT